MILGTRGSRLALGQSGWVRDRLRDAHPGSSFDLIVIKTTGDRRQETASGEPTDKGIFVKEIEEALLDGRIDAAVHSLKDLPTEQPEGLEICCVPVREDPRDVLVTKDGLALEALPKGARVGTGSPRRAAQLLAARPDLDVAPVRGNVDTRIRRLLEGTFHAVVLAGAGMARLGLRTTADRWEVVGAIGVPIPEEICLPAVGQGALAIESRRGDEASVTCVRVLHDPASAAEVAAERAFLEALGGGCRVPVAALARALPNPGSIAMTGVVIAPDGSKTIRVRGEGDAGGAGDLGRRLASEALARGAQELLGGASD